MEASMSQPAFLVLPDPAAADRFAVARGPRELGWFSLRGLHSEGRGRRLAAAIGGPRQTRFPGPHGLVDDVAVAPGVCPGDLEAMFAAIAGRALARLYGAVFVCGADRRLAPALRALGVEQPEVLAATGVAPVIGVFEPGSARVLARVRAFERTRALAAAA
jgi:hypothetical protein